MILDQERFEQLLIQKKENYNKEASDIFFKNNNKISPCIMSEKATILYHLMQRDITINDNEFSEDDKKEVEAFIKCLESQMELVIKGELTPVNMTLEEIINLVRLSDEEIKSCCISEEEIKKIMTEMSNG